MNRHPDLLGAISIKVWDEANRRLRADSRYETWGTYELEAQRLTMQREVAEEFADRLWAAHMEAN